MAWAFKKVYEVGLPALYPTKPVDPQSKGEVYFFTGQCLFQFTPVETDSIELVLLILIHGKTQMPVANDLHLPQFAVMNDEYRLRIADPERLHQSVILQKLFFAPQQLLGHGIDLQGSRFVY